MEEHRQYGDRISDRPDPGKQPLWLGERRPQTLRHRFLPYSWVPVARQPAPVVELARVGTGEPGQTPPPARRLPPPDPPRKDCDSVTCRPPSFCSRGVCQGAAKKAPPAKLAGGQTLGPSSFAARAAWQDIEPEPFLARPSDSQWLAGVLQ